MVSCRLTHKCQNATSVTTSTAALQGPRGEEPRRKGRAWGWGGAPHCGKAQRGRYLGMRWASLAFFHLMCLRAVLLQSRLSLCGPVDCSPAGSSVHGILQARALRWVASPSSRESSQPRDGTRVSYTSCIGRWVLYRLDYLGSPYR